MSKGIPAYILSLIYILLAFNINAQKERILLDGQFTDWENRTFQFEDKSGDGRFGYDFTQLSIENDENYIYFSFDAGLEINLQEYNDVTLVLDTDSDYSTGYPIDNMGAELIYVFGDRGGVFYYGSSQKSIEHNDIGLISLPTVSSDRFEIVIHRSSTINGNPLFPESTIKCMLLQDVQNGDKLPDQSGGVSFSFSEETMAPLPSYEINKQTSTDFRLVSYNTLQDRLYEAQNSFQRILTAVNPDIIAFQEVYDHTAAQTKTLISSWLGGQWYAAKQGSDIITVSRFPILESHYIAGNGAFLLDINGEEVLLINAHLPCCDNDSGRQDEVDQIMAFIRDAQNGQSSLDLKEKTPIIITGDMNFVGKNRQVKTFLKGDIQNEFLYGNDFMPDWDGTEFNDVLSFVAQTPLAITWNSPYSSYNPGRLDYVIYSDAVLKLKNSFNLLTSSLPQDSLTKYAILKDDTDIASDHIPVVADFVIDYTNNTNITDRNIYQMNVFPIPFNTGLNLEITGSLHKNGLLFIQDLSGKTMLNQRIEPGQISLRLDTDKWPAGSYIISLICEGKLQQTIHAVKTN